MSWMIQKWTSTVQYQARAATLYQAGQTADAFLTMGLPATELRIHIVKDGWGCQKSVISTDGFKEVSKVCCTALQVDILGYEGTFPFRASNRNKLAFEEVSPHRYSRTGYQRSCLWGRFWPVVNCTSSWSCET